MSNHKKTDVAERRRSGSTRRAFVAGAVGVAGALAFTGARVWHRTAHAVPDGFTEYTGRFARLADLDGVADIDVCIVGSGPAGSVLGTEIARHGARTLVIEAGVNPTEMQHDARYGSLNSATHSGDVPYPLTATRAMMPGGTTSLWTGNTPRLLPLDFEHNAYTPAGSAWPITYASIDPFYEKAEYTLDVSGESNVRYTAPRHRSLPRETHGNPFAKALLRRVGVESFDTFRSHSSYGGPVRAARDLLPLFTRLPSAVFLPGVTARRFIASSSQHIDSVLLEDLSGRQSLVRAKIFVLAAGGVESARRLLLSRSEFFPQGPGNWHDQVGRTFADHYYVGHTGYISSTGHKARTLPQSVRSFQFYESTKKRGLGSIDLTLSVHNTENPSQLELKLTTGCEVEPQASNRITLNTASRDLFGDPIAHLHFGWSTRDNETQALARSLGVGLLRRLGAPQPEELVPFWGHHHLGTVRMGANPRTSVVDSNLRVHGVNNLFALTSGNFVTCGPNSPTLLIVALAHRLSAHVLSELRAGALSSASVTANTTSSRARPQREIGR